MAEKYVNEIGLIEYSRILKGTFEKKADKTELHSHKNKAVLDEITQEDVTSWSNKSDFSGKYSDLEGKPSIPTKTSDLTNDSDFQTSEDVESAITEKGYQTADEVNNVVDGAVDGIDNKKMDKVNPTGSGSFSIGRLADSEVGSCSIAIGYELTASAPYSFAEGYGNVVNQSYAHVEGRGNTASGQYSHAEGYGNVVSQSYAHVEGRGNTASGYYSHAEGNENTAIGNSAHVEGRGNTASGYYSHAEGNENTAIGNSAHVEGRGNTASGTYAHAEGFQTTASSNFQTVFGRNNIEDAESKFIEIGGNGTSLRPSNARTLDWSGNEWIAGDYTNGAGQTLSDAHAKIAELTATIEALTERVEALEAKVV